MGMRCRGWGIWGQILGTGTSVGQDWRPRSSCGGGHVPGRWARLSGRVGSTGAHGVQLSYSLVGFWGAEASCEITLARAQRSPEGLCLSSMTNPIR